MAGRMNPTIRCVEPAACPTLTKGEYRYDFGDTAGMTPLMKMHTLGHGFIPDAIHAGGLRYHGMAPLVSHLYELGLVEAVAIPQLECFGGAVELRPAPKASCPRPSRPMPSPQRSVRRCAARNRARRRSSSPRCAGTATSTSRLRVLPAGTMVDLDLSESDHRGDGRRSRHRLTNH